LKDKKNQLGRGIRAEGSENKKDKRGTSKTGETKRGVENARGDIKGP